MLSHVESLFLVVLFVCSKYIILATYCLQQIFFSPKLILYVNL